ncbi:MAG: carbohydrate kinase family protein [Elainella sp.]
MTTLRALCLGEILWDCLADQPTPVSPLVRSWKRYPGGAPANVACALAKLGTPTGFIGGVGTDELGQALVELLQSLNVNTVGVQHHPASTRQVEVWRLPNGDCQFVGFRDYPASAFADAQLRADLLPLELFSTADFLVLGSLELAYPNSRSAVQRALELAKQHDLKVLVDINWRPSFWPEPEQAKPVIQELMQQVDFLKLTQEEAEWLLGTADPVAIAEGATQLMGVLVTAGAEGCAYWLNQHQGKVPAFGVEVEDTNGAGDSFVAGFVHQLCRQGLALMEDASTAREAVVYASAVAALTTTRAGALAAQPSSAEVEAFLYLHRQP